jgi:hypothetical protein
MSRDFSKNLFCGATIKTTAASGEFPQEYQIRDLSAAFSFASARIRYSVFGFLRAPSPLYRSIEILK